MKSLLPEMYIMFLNTPGINSLLKFSEKPLRFSHVNILLYSEFKIFAGLEDSILKFHRGASDCDQYTPQTTDTPCVTGFHPNHCHTIRICEIGSCVINWSTSDSNPN